MIVMDINYYSPKNKLSVRSLTTIAGVLQSDIYEVLREAERLETMRRFKENVSFLNGQNILFYTENPTGPMRLSFEIAVRSVGGNSIVMPAASDPEDFNENLSVAALSDVAAIFIDKQGVFGYANKLPQNKPVFNLTGIDNPVSVLSVLFVLKKRFGYLKDLKVAIKDRSNLILALSKCEADIVYLTDEVNGIAENDVKYLSQFCPVNVGIIGAKGLKAAAKDPLAILSVDPVDLDEVDSVADGKPDFALYYPLEKSDKNYDVTKDCTLALADILRAILNLTVNS